MEFSFGKVVSGSKRWEWEPKVTVRAFYWEIWEVVVAAQRNGNARRMRVYPAINLGLYATSRGQLMQIEIDADQNKRPPEAPENYDYESHDLFGESRPGASPEKAIRGMFKIKGTVYFLPNQDGREHPWVTAFLDGAERNLRVLTAYNSFYTGGPLWQRESFFRPPGGTKIITRYEAGEFYDVRQAHITPDCKERPLIVQYSRPCSYPGQMCNGGPFHQS